MGRGLNRRALSVHRLEVIHGPIAEGMHAVHRPPHTSQESREEYVHEPEDHGGVHDARPGEQRRASQAESSDFIGTYVNV
jgi:hypothetical protein